MSAEARNLSTGSQRFGAFFDTPKEEWEKSGIERTEHKHQPT
jgi:hypothetical protein